jgi:ferritin-like metal-binding protein YciE
MKGLVQEAEEFMSEAQSEEVLDAGLIGCAQAVERYEMARYDGQSSWR